jgi:hypothetical protein
MQKGEGSNLHEKSMMTFLVVLWPQKHQKYHRFKLQKLIKKKLHT